MEPNTVIDAGEALANVETTTTPNSEDTITNLKTVSQTVEEPTEVIQEEEVIEETPIETPTTEDTPSDEPSDEPTVETETVEEATEKEEEEPTPEKDNDDYAEDLVYIKKNPEKILELIQDLQNSRFQNKWKTKYDLELAEKQELETKIKELQKERFASKYDDANLPILEEKRWMRRSQNKYYSDRNNEAYRTAYLKRLNEEIEDLQLETKTVAVDNKETTTPESKAPTPYQTLGRVWVAITKPRR